MYIFVYMCICKKNLQMNLLVLIKIESSTSLNVFSSKIMTWGIAVLILFSFITSSPFRETNMFFITWRLKAFFMKELNSESNILALYTAWLESLLVISTSVIVINQSLKLLSTSTNNSWQNIIQIHLHSYLSKVDFWDFKNSVDSFLKKIKIYFSS